jgi:hypothetical protein
MKGKQRIGLAGAPRPPRSAAQEDIPWCLYCPSDRGGVAEGQAMDVYEGHYCRWAGIDVSLFA